MSLRVYEKVRFSEAKRIERFYDTVVFIQCEQVVLETFIDPKRVSDSESNGLRHIAF